MSIVLSIALSTFNKKMNMKKVLLFGLFLASTFITQAQKKSSQKKFDGKKFTLVASYSMPKRTEFDKYVKTISDSAKLKNTLNVNKAYGLHFNAGLRSRKNEIEAGVAFFKTISIKESNSNNSSFISVNNTNVDVHFGYNRYLNNIVFWGMDFVAMSNNGKITYEGTAVNYFEQTPESSNPFKGYQFVFRPKFGFNFLLGEKICFRVNAFYDMALSKYEFYKNDIFNLRLKNYTGITKSDYKNFGVMAGIYF